MRKWQRRNTIARRLTLYGVWMTVVVLSAGCMQPINALRKGPSMAGGHYSKEELREALGDFADYFVSTIKQAAVDVDESADNRKAVRKITLQWKVRMVSACRTVLEQDDPIKAFLDAWVLCTRLRLYFTEGEGQALFGESQHIAVEAAQKLEADIARIGSAFLTPDKLASTRKEVERFAAENPMTGVFSRNVVRTPPPEKDVANPFVSIITMPLAPFRTFEGIDRGAEAIKGFTVVADRFTDIVDGLPETTRWQLELLIYELEESELILRFLASMEEFTASTKDLVATADRLPEQLREQTGKLIEEIDARQANLQASLKHTETAATAIEKAMQRVNEAATTLDTTSHSVTETARAWESAAHTIGQTVKEFQKEPGTAPATRPFDINDYRSTAEALTQTAVELRTLTTEIRELLAEEQIARQIEDVDTRLKETVDHTAEQARHLSNQLTWRGVLLLVMAFGLALIYRAVSCRMGKRAG
ncbi:MAG: hypothetical protein GXY44_10755 [Phycisphaerales bacterium]|nr:hypothetical protein [Phycisphaerales bacterium]